MQRGELPVVRVSERLVRVRAASVRRLMNGDGPAVQRLKHHLGTKAAKTVNNVLTVLNVLLKTAVEWDVIERLPCTIRLLPTPKTTAQFHDFDAYERLVKAAAELDRRTHLLVLFGGEAGLRCGEMMALEWDDVDLEKRQLRCAVGLEGPGHGDQGGPRAVRADDGALGSGAAGSIAISAADGCSAGDGEPLTQKVVQDHCGGRAGRARAGQGCTSSGTRSARTWRCAGRRRGPSRSWRGTRT